LIDHYHDIYECIYCKALVHQVQVWTMSSNPQIYSRETSLQVSIQEPRTAVYVPAKELDFDPIGQNQSPVSDGIQGRLRVSDTK